MTGRQTTGVRNERILRTKTAQVGIEPYHQEPHEVFHRARFGSQPYGPSSAQPVSSEVSDSQVIRDLCRSRALGLHQPAAYVPPPSILCPAPTLVPSLAPAPRVSSYPIHEFKEQIQDAVMNSPITIIRGATGCGKSIFVPEFLQEIFSRVISMQPRRVLAETLAAYRAELSDSLVGDTVGFQHSKATLRSHLTEILYITYGTQLVKDLQGRGMTDDCVYIFDEKHEARVEMDLLLGLLLKRAARGEKVPKIVIMSATLDTETLLTRFPGAPFIDVPGRRFPIIEVPPKATMADDIVAALERGKTPLCFVYGKRPIQDTIAEVQVKFPGVTAIPFHSNLSRAELRRPFADFNGPTVVVSTDIAESGLSMRKIDCVIMSGLARVPMLIDGVESLVVTRATEFNIHQGESRGNRFGPGESIFRGGDRSQLALMPAPEIQCKRLDAEYLKIVAGGEDFRTIVGFATHRPSQRQIVDAERRLKSLGLITTARPYRATPDGLYVASLPIAPSSGKIISLARKIDQGLGKVTATAIDVAAVIEAEGIINAATKEARALLGDFGNSEPLAQARLLGMAASFSAHDLHKYGIHPTKLGRALEVRQTLRERLGLESRVGADEDLGDRETHSGVGNEQVDYVNLSADEQQQVLHCIWKAQLDSLFRQVGRSPKSRGKKSNKSKSDDGKPAEFKQLKHREERRAPRGVRQLPTECLAIPSRFMVGTPFNLGDIDSQGKETLNRMLLMPSAIPKKWLIKNVFPELKEALDSALETDRKRHSHEKRSERNGDVRRGHSRGRH